MVVRIRGKIDCVSWFEELISDRISPDGLRVWAATQPSRAAAWTSCPRGDWQLWLAAHAPALTEREQRGILKQALDLIEDARGTGILWFLSTLKVTPTKLDVVDAWVHARGGKLGLSQKLMASGLAFAFALALGVLVDRRWLGGYGEGFSRTLMQGVVCTTAWLILIPLTRAIWRSRIDRGLEGLTFDGAFAMIWATISRWSNRVSEAQRAAEAKTVRIWLNDLGQRAFS
jgi:hypothetical protein